MFSILTLQIFQSVIQSPPPNSTLRFSESISVSSETDAVFTKTHWSFKTEASESEVGPEKIENQEVRLAFDFIIYFRGPVKIIGGQSIQTIHWSYWPASLNSFREDC
jgi:hypothetical protein